MLCVCPYTQHILYHVAHLCVSSFLCAHLLIRYLLMSSAE